MAAPAGPAARRLLGFPLTGRRRGAHRGDQAAPPADRPAPAAPGWPAPTPWAAGATGHEGGPPEALLTVERLSAGYGAVQALDGVDLRVHEGEIVAIAGENGAGKSTLVRCIAGDIAGWQGVIRVGGRRLAPTPRSAAGGGVAVVWQDLALCENLDVAANLLLGQERGSVLVSETRSHSEAARLLADLGIPLPDTYRPVSSLSGGQRQLVAVARAMRARPRLLILDEPTGALGVTESAQVEELTRSLKRRGTTILLVSHDLEQLFRLADRIVVLRHGRIVAEVDPATSHPDEVVALLAGQEVDTSARRQLSRLQGLADRLASADPSSSLSLIMSALGAALGTEQVVLHLVEDGALRAPSAFGLPASLIDLWRYLPLGAAGGPPGATAELGTVVVDRDTATSEHWAPFRAVAQRAGIAGSWSVPVIGVAGLLGVITVLRRRPGEPERDELELVGLYAGYAAGVVDRDRLLQQLQSRNRILETIREVLETLAGPVPVGDALVTALRSLRHGLQADGVALVAEGPDGAPVCRAFGGTRELTDEEFASVAASVWAAGVPELRSLEVSREDGSFLAVGLPAPEPAALLARWASGPPPPEASMLLDDAANSLRLALERQGAERALQDAAALRRSQDLQRQFLSRLSHELRTPLTAIQGYASTLRQPDVTWDQESEDRFLDRIGAESARVGRLVDDLLDFSAIESGVLRIHPDWCDLPLVAEAARTCLRPEDARRVAVDLPADLPTLWADHDRLEQVFVNLLDNGLRHNPPGTCVRVAGSAGLGAIEVTVTDDGVGMAAFPSGPGQGRRSPTAGAGLGLSIARAIVAAHGGVIDLVPRASGTCFRIQLPIEGGQRPPDATPDG
jgi:ABC-type multidrug transport system ATPase subunit/signal transduction histidine kinase